MKTKKGQVQMGESIAIIIVLLIILVVGFVFYAKVKASDIKGKGNIYDELDIVKLSQLVYSLPEIQCSFAEVTDYGCIDYLKFYYLGNMINHSTEGTNKDIYYYYREMFGNANISLFLPLPLGNLNPITINLYNNPTNGSKNTVFMPVTLFDPINNSNEFGVLVIEKYN